MIQRPACARLGDDPRGSVVVEFALVAPFLLLLLLGILAYGQFFWLSHSVQQIANDAARATVAGLTLPERETLARDSARHAGTRTDGVAAARLVIRIEQAAPWVTVTARYDASDVPLLRAGLLPMPGAVIERRATVRMGAGA